MQARAAETMAGAAPQVQRNKGSMGSKDLHLENFSVSNGGQELIEVCQRPVIHARIHLPCTFWHMKLPAGLDIGLSCVHEIGFMLTRQLRNMPACGSQEAVIGSLGSLGNFRLKSRHTAKSCKQYAP